MNVLGDLVSRDHRSDAPALSVPALGRAYDYRRFCTTAWKTGNFLRHCGVRGGSTVAIADDPQPEPILSFFGTVLLGGVARFLVPSAATVDARVLITPVEDNDEHSLPPGSQRIVYGDPPDDPTVAYFEGDVWSENPTEPPDVVTPDQPVLRTSGATYTHAALLDAARSVVEQWELTASDVVAVRAPLWPGTIVAGILAPLLVGGTILFPDSEHVGDCAVTTENKPEERSLSPEAVGIDS